MWLLAAAMLLAACSGARNTAAVPAAVERTTAQRAVNAGTITLHVYDSSGNRISWNAFRALESDGKGSNGLNDAILDASSLRILSQWPLASSGGGTGDPTLSVPSGNAALALAWPTSDGYSNLIFALPSTGGTYIFNQLAAKQLVADLDAAKAARPWYVPSAAFTTSSLNAHTALSGTLAAASEAQTGAMSAQAMDAAIHAERLLLSESGPQFARTKAAGSLAWGVTFDEIAGGVRDLASVASLVAPAAGDAWIRVVFDRQEPASYYAAEIAEAHALGMHVVGQLLDSSDMSAVSLTKFQARVQSYVATLPAVDEWEVGNEVNGNWLGSDVVAKVSYAAAYVKSHTNARTLLTLYWQLGEDVTSDAMFNWAATNLTSTIMSNIDDIGLSLYPENNPMGSAFDRVLQTLHAAYPNQSLMITELDYWSSDLSHTWWWGSQTDPTGAGRIAVAQWYGAAGLSYPYYRGGTFWWYYLEEAAQGNALWDALASLHQSAY